MNFEIDAIDIFNGVLASIAPAYGMYTTDESFLLTFVFCLAMWVAGFLFWATLEAAIINIFKYGGEEDAD